MVKKKGVKRPMHSSVCPRALEELYERDTETETDRNPSLQHYMFKVSVLPETVATNMYMYRGYACDVINIVSYIIYIAFL